jgi:hypothetical protein
VRRINPASIAGPDFIRNAILTSSARGDGAAQT